MNRVQKISQQLDQSQKVDNTPSHNNNIHWVKVQVKNNFKFTFKQNLKGKTVVMTGGSRGIGLAVAKKIAKDGANIAILAKTITPHPKLPGTIYTAAKEIEECGGTVLAVQCDVKSEQSVKDAIQKVVDKFGGIDILINNASAIIITDTENSTMKLYDLSHDSTLRGTFMVSKYCLPYLKKSTNPHILNMSPKLDMLQNKEWAKRHLPYTIQKIGMTMCALGMSEEFKEYKIGVNTLWPKTTIATTVIMNVGGGEQMMQKSLSVELMADASYIILTSDSQLTNGKFFHDDEVMANVGINDLSKYKFNSNIKDIELNPDLFI